jgi:predicted HD phosphohydrolase
MTTAALARLATLFESEAMADPYGEDISIRAHMLQCAELAQAQGLDDTLVAAALLHDIGWGMEAKAAGHQHAAADLLLPLFGPAVAEPVRQHVAAKRYLVATRPDYAARLSDCSRETLALQGGPFTPGECSAFEGLVCFRAAVALRYLDDAGKALHQPKSRFGDYMPLLRRLMQGKGEPETTAGS